jgi:hypothetical protein
LDKAIAALEANAGLCAAALSAMVLLALADAAAATAITDNAGLTA